MLTTGSPLISIAAARLPPPPLKLTVADAVITVVTAGRLMLAVAVDEASEPDSWVLDTVARVPNIGVTANWTTVPVGMFAAEMATVTGLVTVEGTTISGGPRKVAAGFGGAFIPATDVIFNCILVVIEVG